MFIKEKRFTLFYYGILIYCIMPRHILILIPEKEVLKKIRIAEHALTATPHRSVKEAAMKELEKLYKELEETRNPK